ncbi:TolC family outer membrane protein [Paraburkholderia humisilvae]|uniref:Outer membrane protein TolC n=1 Tax=Paraburkholderia humisilvae TaxID=627669 RepID=A0A6J5DVA4_9BURK|nr:TolC family outer membrane protein [Paraburkholderia humisilvae]CAB3756845.1 Outer membrane protein TolC [Paraburkholderia humisilvae]
MIKRCLAVCACAALLVESGHARAVDLLSVVEQAVDHDASVAQARASYEAARQAVPAARGALLPQLSGGWGRGYNRIDTEDFPRSSYWQSGWTVSLTQPLFDWTRWTTYQQAGVIEARGAVEYGGARQASMLRAAKAYFDELAAEDDLRRVEDYLVAIDVEIEQLHRRRDAGEATDIDLREAQTLRGEVVLQRRAAQNALQTKRRALEQVTGAPFEPLARLNSATALPAAAPADPDAWAEQAREHGFGVQMRQLDMQIAQYDVSKAQAAHYPVAGVTATYSPAGAAAGYARPTTTTTAMFTVTIPIFSGGELQAKVRTSEALEDKARNGLLSAQRDAEAAARDSFARYEAGRERTGMLIDFVESCRDTLTATQAGDKVGSRTSTDVLRAMNALYAAQRDLRAARYDTIVALLQLKADTASLDTDDIVAVGTLLMGQSPSHNAPM